MSKLQRILKRCQRVASCMLAFLILVSAVQAQTGDWQAVKDITPDTHISVKGNRRFRIPCIFRRATEEELVCDHMARESRFPIHHERIFDRRNIREIRLEYNDASRRGVAVAIGFAAGTTIGVAARNNGVLSYGHTILLGGVVGGILGWLFDRKLNPPRHKVVYKR